MLSESRAYWLRRLAADVDTQRARAFRIKCLVAFTLAALICGGPFWALRGNSPYFAAAVTRLSAVLEFRKPLVARAAPKPVTQLPGTPGEASLANAAEPQTILLEVLPGISYETGPDFARFFFEVQEQQRIEAVALRNPDRIYFDVAQSNAGLSNRSVEMNNDFVRRIRVLQKDGRGTRFVLDLKCPCAYRLQQPSSNLRHGLELELRPPSEEPAPGTEASHVR